MSDLARIREGSEQRPSQPGVAEPFIELVRDPSAFNLALAQPFASDSIASLRTQSCHAHHVEHHRHHHHHHDHHRQALKRNPTLMAQESPLRGKILRAAPLTKQELLQEGIEAARAKPETERGGGDSTTP